MFHRVKSEPNTPQNKPATETKDAAEPVKQSTPSPQPATHATLEKDQTMSKAPAQNDEQSTETKAASKPEYAAPAGYRASAAPARPGYVGNSYPSNAGAQAAQKKAEAPAEEKPAPVKAEAPREAAENSRLLIGPGITMSGEIEYCDTLVVEGTVEAALKGARTLEIAESGVFYGAVSIEEATVSGRFEGDITVAGRLTITETGVVTGSIAYGSLDVESGAVIEGSISTVKTGADQQRKREQAGRGASAMARGGAASAEQEPANAQGGELFSQGA